MKRDRRRKRKKNRNPKKIEGQRMRCMKETKKREGRSGSVVKRIGKRRTRREWSWRRRWDKVVRNKVKKTGSGRGGGGKCKEGGKENSVLR